MIYHFSGISLHYKPWRGNVTLTNTKLSDQLSVFFYKDQSTAVKMGHPLTITT